MTYFSSETFKQLVFITVVSICAISFSTTSQSQEKVYSRQGIAIAGYDTVAFFTQDKAIQGSSQFQTEWQGVKWMFSSAEHLELFKASPQKFIPQFGGFCALGAAHLGAVPTNPVAYSIHKGKLYFNMTKEVRITWQLNADFHIERARKAWEESKITFYN